MTKNPLVNAIAAAAYIIAIASIMFFGLQSVHEPNILIPITILSLFVLSVCVMGFTFFYQPIRMYFDGEKQQAVSLIFKTVTTFACITLLFLLSIFALNI